MPINIYIEESFETVAELCEDLWELPGQIHELDFWLNSKGKILQKGSYVADIRFDIRKDASGSGGVMNSKMIKIMADIGMVVHFSEYPTSQKDSKKNKNDIQ